ncbi:suv3 RNA helicase isoform X2 [Nomia melanderi]|uniref:suv3 RNA helicase isoform X2 n=1 Tax=Nomia melanderi TaxID=2448451 RepID=UPI003FCE587A
MDIIVSKLNPKMTIYSNVRKYSKKRQNISSLVHPAPVKCELSNVDIGAELTGNLNKNDINKTLILFSRNESLKQLASSYGIDETILRKALTAFRTFCMTSKTLPTDLHVILNDIIKSNGNVTDIFPYFLRYTKQLYPHIDCMDDLKKISDLRNPTSWYPIARSKKRKIIFHSGPTNSGKTYHALQRFMSAKSGVYCGPLKLLAVEIFTKCNSMGTPCDLITGEERKYAKNEMSPASHVSCSVEMVNVENIFEVAVIDEIQMLRDTSRGWAWTRALLGIAADEIHLCGEQAAIPIVQSICETMGETVIVHDYKRLTDLKIEDTALRNLNNVKPGDCIVCFNKNDIFHVSQILEKLEKQVAVIYGSLPPGTKLAQASKFNDPENECKILVATNAIGMGLNLHIRRIIFYSLQRPTTNENGTKEMDIISVSSALQIAGRAGRYKSNWSCGYVTTFKDEDLSVLKKLLEGNPDTITHVGLHPTAEQIELYAYHLPNTPLSNLIDIFVALSEVDDSLYFICNLDDFKFLSNMIDHIPLNLRAKYTFCCAPINKKMTFACNMFIKYARQCSKNEKITVQWMRQQINWPLDVPKNIADLIHLETVFDVLDIYLWLSYRFTDLFPDGNDIREIQQELDKIIEMGIKKLKILFRNKAYKSPFLIIEDPIEDTEHHQIGSGRLTNKLLSQGLLTPKLLEALQKEWSETSKNTPSTMKELKKEKIIFKNRNFRKYR